DLWSDNPDELEDIQLSRCQVQVEVIDAASKLHLNTATKNQLLALPDMTEEIADSILDWRDKDDTIRASGAEAGYYQNLEYGYRAKNAGFKTVRELLLVRGVTEELMYATGPEGYLSPDNEGWIYYLTVNSLEYNRDALGQKKVDLNKANENQLRRQLSLPAGQAKWIVENRPFKKWSDLLGSGNNASQQQNQNNQNNQNQSNKGNSQSNVTAEKLNTKTVLSLIDKATVSTKNYLPGLVNVNTAGLVVLTALMEGDQTSAENVLAYRLGLEGGLTSLADLQNVEGMTEPVLKKLLDTATVRSSVYEIYSTGLSDTTALCYTIETVMNRDQQEGQVIYWHESTESSY
ncbi:MAG: type II secretion system protein GspK, partial [Planctomycetota bacterium]